MEEAGVDHRLSETVHTSRPLSPLPFGPPPPVKPALALFCLSCVSLIAGDAVQATAITARPPLSGVEAPGKTLRTAGGGRWTGSSETTFSPLSSLVQGVAGASRFVNASGSDRGSCRRSAPCKTFDRAYQVASPGETISVAGGVYSSTWPAAGAHAIMKPGKPAGSAPITFTCSGPVRFDATAPNFLIYPGVHSLNFRGDCFRFHIVQIGLGGYTGLVAKITFTGVKMDSFECAGCDHLTIRDSEIGPMVACHGKGTTGVGGNGGPITSAMWCSDSDAGSGAYWASQPRGTDGTCNPNPTSITEAQGFPDNILLEGNLIHGMQTKDPTNAHTGGLLIWNANGVTMRNNVFKNNAIYDVVVDGTAANWVVENNFFGWPVQPLGNGVGAVETPKDWREFGSKDAVVHRNWLIRYNSFAHGLSLGRNSLNNVRVIGNILGNYSNCTRGVFFDSNVTVAARPCGANAKRRARYPYANYAKVDFHLRRWDLPAGLEQKLRLPSPNRLRWRRAPGAAKRRRRRAESVALIGATAARLR